MRYEDWGFFINNVWYWRISNAVIFDSLLCEFCNFLLMNNASNYFVISSGIVWTQLWFLNCDFWHTFTALLSWMLIVSSWFWLVAIKRWWSVTNQMVMTSLIKENGNDKMLPPITCSLKTNYKAWYGSHECLKFIVQVRRKFLNIVMKSIYM